MILEIIGRYQWLRSYIKFPTGGLELLSEILKESVDPSSSRYLTVAARQYWYRWIYNTESAGT